MKIDNIKNIKVMKNEQTYQVFYEYYDARQKYHENDIFIDSKGEPSEILIKECICDSWHRKGYKFGHQDSIQITRMESVGFSDYDDDSMRLFGG